MDKGEVTDLASFKHVDDPSQNPDSGVAATDRYGHALVEYDPATERRLRNKIDLYIVPIVALLYLFCFIDRANIGNAKIAGLEKDLGMTGYDYNGVVSVFYVSYILFEIPLNLLCKWMGPGWFIPMTTLLFGIVSLGTAFATTLAQLSAVRFLLGIFEAGMMPGIAYYLSRWYRRSELAFRLALLEKFGSLHSWRMIFAIEGIVTIGLGLLGLVFLTDRPETARWLTPEEKRLAVLRVKSERVGTTTVLDKMDKRKLILGIRCPVTLSIAVAFMLNNITVQGLAFFLPTIVGGIYPQASTVRKQLYTVPPYIVGAFFVLFLPLVSWRIDRRQILLIGSAPLVMVGYCMFLGSQDQAVRYGATFLITSSLFAVGPLSNAQVSANVVSDTARSSAIGTNVMMGNIGGLVSGWSFLPWDGPDYHIGNGLNLAAAGTVLIVCSLTLVWMDRDNKRRDQIDVDAELSGLSEEQIEDLDWKHPAFRWRP
uniref:Major facilitator superfamily (MFS) profile domain-containing protein n=1 Tax=Bionectria ochroleuca TaxID=29856 RepID=A0A8H7KA07_BIOOC